MTPEPRSRRGRPDRGASADDERAARPRTTSPVLFAASSGATTTPIPAPGAAALDPERPFGAHLRMARWKPLLLVAVPSVCLLLFQLVAWWIVGVVEGSDDPFSSEVSPSKSMAVNLSIGATGVVADVADRAAEAAADAADRAAEAALAREAYPHLSFEVVEMGSLEVPDVSAAAVVSWYSLIHIAAASRPAVVAELARVLRPGGYLLLAFQVGHDTLHFDEAFGHAVDLDFHRLDPDAVETLTTSAGLTTVARTVRAPERQGPAATVPQGFVLAQRPCPMS